MPDSDTSSEINVNLYDNNGKIENKSETKKSSDTDYYFNMLANQNKTVADKVEQSSSSDIAHSESSSDSSKKTSSVKKNHSTTESTDSDSNSKKSESSSKSRNRYETVNFGTLPMPNNTQSFQNTSNNPQAKASTPTPKPISPPSIVSTANVVKQLTPQETRMKKIELLRKLSEIKSKGFSLTKEYDFNSSLEEMEYEFELLKSFVDKRNGIKVYKNILLNGVSIMEFLNEKYDPFDFHLEGWGEHMSVEVDSYDDVLEELYEKYKGTGKSMPPEIKLLLLLVASGSAYHFSKSQSSIPGLEAAISRNPELISKLLNPQKPKSQFMTEQEISIIKQRELIQQREKELKQKQQQQQQNRNVVPQMNMPLPTPTPSMQMPTMQMPTMQMPKQNNSFMSPPNMPSPNPTMMQPEAANQSRDKILPGGVPEIRAPGNVHEILNRIRNQNLAASHTDTNDSTSNNDRLVSDVNLSESKKGKKGKKPVSVPSISINI